MDPVRQTYPLVQALPKAKASCWERALNCLPGQPLGKLPELAGMNWDILNLITGHHYTEEVDGISKLQLGHKTFIIVSNPEKIKEILKEPKHYPRGKSLALWRKKFSPGGLTEGRASIGDRKQAINVVSPKNLKNYFSGITKVSKVWADHIGCSNKVDIMAEAERATLAVMGRNLFKIDPEDPEEPNPFGLNTDCQTFLSAYHQIFEMLSRRIPSPVANIPYIGDYLYRWMNPEDEEILNKAKAHLKQILEPILHRLFARYGEIGEESHLRKFVEHFNIDPNNYDIDDVLNKCLGFLQAFFETTSKAIGWSLYLLAQHQEKQDELREKLQERFADQDPKNFKEILEVPLLRQVVEESLRLFPPFPFLLRDNPETGEAYVLSPLLTHRNGSYWKDPDTFKPERFTEEMTRDGWQINNKHYLTFLGGIHRCPGRHFAKQEIQIFLTEFLRKYKVHPVGNDPVELKLNITLHPKKPVYLRLESVA